MGVYIRVQVQENYKNIDCIDEELDFGPKEVILGFKSKAQKNELWPSSRFHFPSTSPTSSSKIRFVKGFFGLGPLM